MSLNSASQTSGSLISRPQMGRGGRGAGTGAKHPRSIAPHAASTARADKKNRKGSAARVQAKGNQLRFSAARAAKKFRKGSAGHTRPATRNLIVAISHTLLERRCLQALRNSSIRLTDQAGLPQVSQLHLQGVP